MRLKQLWMAVPLPAKVKLFWERVTFSHITKIYFLFSVLHCLVQLVFQIQAFSTNARAADFLWHLVTQAKTVDPGFSVFEDDELRFCDSVPDGITTTNCQLIWAAKNDDVESEPVSSSVVPTSTFSPAFTPSPSNNELSEPAPTIRLVSETDTTTSVLITTTASPVDVQATSSFVSDVAGQLATATASEPSASTNPAVVDLVDAEEEEEEEDDDDLESIASVDSLDSIGSLDSDEEELDRRDLGFRIAAVNVDGSAQVVLSGFDWENETRTLSRRCLYSLNWPVEKLDNTKREDITFIAFQFWVLGMSVVAILNESIPHIIASLLTHVLATAWGGFQVWHTQDFRNKFVELTTSACGFNLLPTYWKPRMDAEIASLAINAASLLISALLSWKLFKLFGWQTFKRVGASRTINRVYKLVLTLSIAIQLSLFFIVVSIALWLDSLWNGVVGRLSTNPTLFKGLMVTVLVLLIPWLALGWISVRRELRTPMLIFLVMSAGYLAGWGAMFTSPTFRWTFVLWRFFMLMTLASVILTLLTLIIGTFCRINFGKGLPRYLNAEEPLPDNFEPVHPQRDTYDDEEKVEFPSSRAALPTFSAAFAKDTPPSQMKFSPARVGPRFTNPSIEPFETDTSSRGTDNSSYQGTFSHHSADSGYQSFPTTYTRDTFSRDTLSDGTTLTDQRHLARQMSVGSQRSYTSASSNSSARTHGSKPSYSSYTSNAPLGQRNDPFTKRWMIE